MKTYQTFLLGCAAVAPAFLIAGTAQAQVGGVAVIQPEGAILNAKAFDTANGTIASQFKTQIEQAAAREKALSTELQALYAPLDTNKDKRLSDEEIAAAQAAKNPAIAKIEAAQRSAQADVTRLTGPATLAQLYAIEQIALRYPEAFKTVIDTKKINLVLAASAVVYGVPTADVTDDVRTELDRISPTVSITPPANWQPTQQAVQLLQIYNTARARQGQAGPAEPSAPAASGAKPAPTKPPVGR